MRRRAAEWRQFGHHRVRFATAWQHATSGLRRTRLTCDTIVRLIGGQEGRHDRKERGGKNADSDGRLFGGGNGGRTANDASAQSFSLTSPVVSEGAPIKAEQVFNKFGCTGKNVSPVLSWSGAPAGAKSFALTIFDPDAPTGSGFWHWVVANIPANVTSLPMNAGDLRGKNLPKGAVQVRNDYGALGYGGPARQKATHITTS
jgi:Raf kinase inhibitor-like YbhB/YbcL family protein